MKVELKVNNGPSFVDVDQRTTIEGLLAQIHRESGAAPGSIQLVCKTMRHGELASTQQGDMDDDQIPPFLKNF